jgi:hypothetical protein
MGTAVWGVFTNSAARGWFQGPCDSHGSVEDDILVQLKDLHRLATVERSYYLAGRCVRDASNEIRALRERLNLPT